MTKTRFIGILMGALLSGSLALPQPALAAEKAEAPVAIPATAPAIWQAIDQQTAALGQAIQTGAFGEVHHRAYAIRDLVLALPVHSSALPPDKLAKVKANLPFVATLAQRLDVTGDAKDRPGTESNFRKLQQVLAAIRANYPKALKP